MRVSVPCWPTLAFAGKTVPRTVFLPGSLLEPDLDRFAVRGLRNRRRTRFGEVFLNASCAAGSDFGCCGRTDSRRKPSAASCLPPRTCRWCARAARRRIPPGCGAAGHGDASAPRRPEPGRDRPRPKSQARPAARVSAAGGGAAQSGSSARPDPRQCSDAPVRRGNCPPDSFLTRLTSASGGPSRRSLPPLCGQRPPKPAQSASRFQLNGPGLRVEFCAFRNGPKSISLRLAHG